ncbi:hypothetical protein AB6Q56_06590 [Dechloromonas sp. ARDL1]|uniref:hypothetical protein n=1 Tax=Dechloromonas sp. ARDL1 TaxID=3322121 RepID=UPI003DA6D430
MNKTILSIGITALAIALYICTKCYAPEGMKMTKIHKLEYPLIISSDAASKNTHMLPKGTVLYFDKSYPEGFSRYKVYINIDRTPLKLENLSDPTEINPIDAFAPSKEDLLKIIRDYPLTKSDLESILDSKRISKDEIREILEKFIRS